MRSGARAGWLLLWLIVGSAAALAAQGSNTEITSYLSAGDFNADPDYAQVLKVDARKALNGTWVFSVKIQHNDEILPDGSAHYADRWEVVDPRSGEVLAVRILTHPHIEEMPFTRSLAGIEIPGDLKQVVVRAACTDHGFEGRQILVPLVQLQAQDRGDS